MRKWLINGFCHKSTRLARSTVTRPVERPSWVRARSGECESGEELAIIRTVVQIKHKARAKRRWTEIAWRCVKSVDYFICTKCATRSSVGFPLSHLRQHSSRAVIGARAPLVVWSDKRTAHTHTPAHPTTCGFCCPLLLGGRRAKCSCNKTQSHIHLIVLRLRLLSFPNCGRFYSILNPPSMTA